MSKNILQTTNNIGQTISINDIVAYPTSATTTEIGVVTKISELDNISVHPLLIKGDNVYLNDAIRNKRAAYAIQITNQFNYMSGTLYGNKQTFLYFDSNSGVNIIKEYLKIELWRMYTKQFKHQLPSYVHAVTYSRLLDMSNNNVTQALLDIAEQPLTYNWSNSVQYKPFFNEKIKPFLEDLAFADVSINCGPDTTEYKLVNFNYVNYAIPSTKGMKYVNGPVFVLTNV